MFVIITYDISDDVRLNKVRKILRKYLYWVQLSTFEGEITKSKLARCLKEIKEVIKEGEDSVYIYRIENPASVEKHILGLDKGLSDVFL